jgi:hypothetical protein
MQASIEVSLIKGEVGWSKTNISWSEQPRKSIACSNTASVPASSVLNASGLEMTSAPWFLDASLISLSSVLTHTSVHILSIAWFILRPIKDELPIGCKFFLGIPLLPPRAGIIPMILMNKVYGRFSENTSGPKALAESELT